MTGSDQDGIPIGAGPHVAAISFEVAAGARSYRGEADGEPPYATWIYAFIDGDGDRALDAGEFFGVAADNPLDLGAGAGCSDGVAAIAIDRVGG